PLDCQLMERAGDSRRLAEATTDRRLGDFAPAQYPSRFESDDEGQRGEAGAGAGQALGAGESVSGAGGPPREGQMGHALRLCGAGRLLLPGRVGGWDSLDEAEL